MNRKLGRKNAHRNHLVRNLATSLVLFERVDTTEAKAKELKQIIDQILSRSAKGDLNARRELLGYFFDRNAAIKVINELLPRYQGRTSGFVKTYHLKNRLGDNSPMMRVELVDRKVFVENNEEKTEVKVRSRKVKEEVREKAKSE